ncbi:MAG: hypothetical protein WKF71_20920 [Pyrinomonadaceae bacterium]
MDKSNSTSVRDAVLGYGSFPSMSNLLHRRTVFLNEFQLQGWVRVAVALLPILPFVLFLSMVLAEIRSLDELWRRIHLEALAIAFPLAVLLLMILGLMELATGLSPERLELSARLDIPADFLRDWFGCFDKEIQMKNRLRVLRAEQKWSQAEVAERLGVSRQNRQCC